MFASTNIALVAGIIFIFHYRNSDGACLLSASNPHCICFQVLLCLIYHKTYIKQCQVTAIIAVMKYMSPLVISPVSYILSNIYESLSGSFYNQLVNFIRKEDLAASISYSPTLNSKVLKFKHVLNFLRALRHGGYLLKEWRSYNNVIIKDERRRINKDEQKPPTKPLWRALHTNHTDAIRPHDGNMQK